MSQLMDYIPHAAVTALATVVAWIGREHMKQDQRGFDKAEERVDKLADKIDANHAQVMNLLIDRLPPTQK